MLAREAKELQGVRSPPSPSPVPPAQAATSAPKKDEGPKPSPAPAAVSTKSDNSESSGYVTSSNAKINGAQESTAANGIEKDKNDNKIEPVPLHPAKSGPANNIKSLEDPSFSMDEAKSSSVTSLPADPAEITAKKTEAKEAPTPTLAPQPKKPSYRVLEDPDLDIPPPRTGSMVPDPMTTSVYEPKQ